MPEVLSTVGWKLSLVVCQGIVVMGSVHVSDESVSEALEVGWFCSIGFSIPLATQLPVCTKQCRDLKLGLSDCYSDSEMVSSSGSGGSMLLEELLQFALNLNCSKPDSFQVSSTLVDQQDCVTLDIYCEWYIVAHLCALSFFFLLVTPDGHGSNSE